MTIEDNLQAQLASLHSISVEIAGLHELSEIHERALGYCLQLTDSEFAFTGLLRDSGGVGATASGQIETSEHVMDVAAIKGFDPSPEFYALFHQMAVRPSVVGVAIVEERSYIANDVGDDPHSIGQPIGHPPIRKFLGVPLRLGATIIGMIGVANKPAGYETDDERLLSTFANQVAVAVDNARLYEHQRTMIAELQRLRERLTEAEQAQLLARERERIAGALHDRVEQQIFTIGLRLNSVLEDEGINRALAERLREIRGLAIKASDEVRRVVFSLAVPGHDNIDLTGAIRSLVSEFERMSGLDTHLFVSGNPVPGVDSVRDVVYSVISEALTNITKHADARVVLVSLRYADDHVDVVIQDDGRGAPDVVLRSIEDSYLHFGLRHMRRQTIGRGGTFEVANGEEAGLVVRIRIPVPAEKS